MKTKKLKRDLKQNAKEYNTIHLKGKKTQKSSSWCYFTPEKFPTFICQKQLPYFCANEAGIGFSTTDGTLNDS